MIKHFLFCYKVENKKLKVRSSVLTDVFVPVQDIISPQKTVLTIPKNDEIQLSDIVIIQDNNTSKIEYIGYIDTLTNKDVTEISCYPLINVFDNDFVLDQMCDDDGSDIDVVQWLKSQIEREFVNTEDELQALPFVVRNMTKSPVFYSKIIDTANLFEVYTDLFINTGVYIDFSQIIYNGNEINNICCDIYCNRDVNPYKLYWDNPQVQSVDIVDNTFTNYNKIIATQELAEGSTATPLRYYFYLLDDNSITTDVKAARRIKQVRSKEITFTLDETKSDQENCNALMQAVINELQAPEYKLKIEIIMFKNDNIKLYRNVDFTAKSGTIYSSNITKIEILNDLQVKVTLGALRNSLTDFKKKIEVI